MSGYLLNAPSGPLEGRPLGFVHRGGAGDDENTLASFLRAHEAGYAYLETDVRLSADGVLYALHDETLARVTGDPRPVAQVGSAELDTLRVLGSFGEPPARVETLLRELPGARLNVDLKVKGAGPEMARLAEEAGALERVLVASFVGRHRRAAQRRAPRLAASAGPGLIAASVLLGPLAAPFLSVAVRRGVVAFQVPTHLGPVPVVRPGWIRRLHAAGLQVHVWVVNDRARMEALLDMGVDGIMSDDAGLLASVLTERGAWPQR